MNSTVLIESDWNLKISWIDAFSKLRRVLIESDWNLKFWPLYFSCKSVYGINRIRLEFKAGTMAAANGTAAVY